MYFFATPMEVSNGNAEVDGTEVAKGGMKYEVIIAEAGSPAPRVLQELLSPKHDISLEDIERKLQRAEERRNSLLAEKEAAIQAKWSHIQEASEKRAESEAKFIESTKTQLEQKMESVETNRASLITSIKAKVKEEVGVNADYMKFWAICSDQEKDVLMQDRLHATQLNSTSLKRQKKSTG
ncbi:unnamed protein product [Darwinula stevensoni]|uniref:Stathmin n=1 Tax=Darwinula stevensoni TaxID=69355 RepID=A0A7R8XAW2_9CRUS|nr:unnamed protein product [Darwinula stevensoni]CAG0887138.1 unnamed protein product [Darwinula stevensoni]